MVAAQTPTIAKIKNEVSLDDVRALLSIAVCEVCDFFNVGKNMNDAQIALTVDLIIEQFWYFKLEEIKYCFRRAMMREKLFDRLDGNIIIGWLREYDAERTEEAMRISEQHESQELSRVDVQPESMCFDEYVADLERRASADPEAARILAEIGKPQPAKLALISREKRAAHEREFQRYRMFEYLSKKSKKS